MTGLSEFFAKQISFKGRSGRTEYFAFFFITGTISTLLDLLAKTSFIFSAISLIYALLVFVPSIAVGVRRLHDLNLSGGWLVGIFAYTLIALITFIAVPTIAALNTVVLVMIIMLPSLFLALAPGKNIGNHYGERASCKSKRVEE